MKKKVIFTCRHPVFIYLYKKHIHNAFIAKKESETINEEENFLNLFMTERFMSYINTPLVLSLPLQIIIIR